MNVSVQRVTRAGREEMELVNYDFLENRTVYLFEEINRTVARDLIAQLRYLDKKGTGDIMLYIDSPGGTVSDGLAIADAMGRCRADIVTVCTGLAASMGAFLLSCGTKGKRYATPLSEIMLHQPLGGVQGQSVDIELAASHIARTRQRLNAVIAQNTGQSMEKVAADTDRDFYLSPEEAVAYGVIDHLLTEHL